MIKKQKKKNFSNGLCIIREQLLWRIPVSTASDSLDFQCLAMFSESGSSGFGALKRA